MAVDRDCLGVKFHKRKSHTTESDQTQHCLGETVKMPLKCWVFRILNRSVPASSTPNCPCVPLMFSSWTLSAHRCDWISCREKMVTSHKITSEKCSNKQILKPQTGGTTWGLCVHVFVDAQQYTFNNIKEMKPQSSLLFPFSNLKIEVKTSWGNLLREKHKSCASSERACSPAYHLTGWRQGPRQVMVAPHLSTNHGQEQRHPQKKRGCACATESLLSGKVGY